MEATQRSTRRLADRTRRIVEGLWQQVLSGTITFALFRSLAASAVAHANAAGVHVADIGLAAEVSRQLRQPVSPLGLRPDPVALDRARMGRDVDRLTAYQDPLPSLSNWAASEVYLTVATATQVGMERREISGWTRLLTEPSCPLCIDWADGIVRPTSVRMKRHNGCDCIQQPVL